MKIVRKQHFLLLEVLIALALVATALLPLLYPHFYIYQLERQFINKINMDIAVNTFYGKIVEQLQRNQIDWNLIANKHQFTVDQQFWQQIDPSNPPPFKGTYHFTIAKNKENEQFGVYQLELTLTATPPGISKDKTKSNSIEYKYLIFASRIISGAPTP